MHDVIRRALLEDNAALLRQIHPYKNGAAPSPEVGSLRTRRIVEIAAKPIEWLWPARIARGKLTIIAGNPGLGKSQITASIAGVITSSRCWPVSGERCKPGAVLFLSAEDDPADTLRPRLEAAGANLERVHFVEGVLQGYSGAGIPGDRIFSLQNDLRALAAKLEELRDVAAVFIDPITAYLGDTDSHKNAEVRAVLAPLSDVASRQNTAIIAVSHLTKAAGAQPLMRVIGSLGFVAAARAAFLVTPDPDDKERRLFLPMKNNLGPDTTGLAFRIEGMCVPSPAGDLATSRIVWESEPVTVTADDVMESEAPGDKSAVGEAKDWLMENLTAGPVEAGQIFKRAANVGIAKKTLDRASKSLGVTKSKTGMTGPWSWSLPKIAKNREGGQAENLGTFGEFGHLRGIVDEEI